VELSERISAAFGGVRLHPESPAEVLRAFSREGIVLASTRAWVLREVDHPAVPLLLEFKELYRIWTAHGWSWRARWVRDGRFKAEYVPGGVVSGRWATRGGGALQIAKAVRRAVVADDGWTFITADAGQLEPRVLAAVAGDARLAAAGASGDLYRTLADDAFGGDRARAKVALLGAMYGQTGGAAAPALATLQARFPTAWAFVESTARTGEGGGLVRSWLGRTCPPARAEEMTGEQARARGRFTRNFVIQATAAEWALALLASLRTALSTMEAELVFFVHDEVVVHSPDAEASAVVEAVRRAGEQATRLLFGDTAVKFPLDCAVGRCYADAKG
jgi:DNA polymerase-1